VRPRAAEPASGSCRSGSMCGSGFSVRRPARSAVSSPRRKAITPCATS
jgi:hypothetical protein